VFLAEVLSTGFEMLHPPEKANLSHSPFEQEVRGSLGRSMLAKGAEVRVPSIVAPSRGDCPMGQ